MSHLKFSLSTFLTNFYPILKLTCLFTVWPKNVRFSKTLECDFFCDFQTLCIILDDLKHAKKNPFSSTEWNMNFHRAGGGAKPRIGALALQVIMNIYHVCMYMSSIIKIWRNISNGLQWRPGKKRTWLLLILAKQPQKWPYRKYKGCILDFDGDLWASLFTNGGLRDHSNRITWRTFWVKRKIPFLLPFFMWKMTAPLSMLNLNKYHEATNFRTQTK